MSEGTNPLGNIYISHRAIASIAHQCAIETYGVVGLAAKNLATGLANVIVKDPSLGVDVQFDGNKLIINLFIVIEYGTRIKSVAATVAETVKYKVEQVIGMPVSQVNVHVRGLRVSE